MTSIEDQVYHRRRHEAEVKLRALKVCLTASTGGHLSELEAFADVFTRHEAFLVTPPSPYSASVMPTVRRRYVRRIARNPANLIVNFFESVRIVLQEKPDVIVSTGAGDSVCVMCVAACLGIPVVFAESMARVSTISLTGRIVRRWVTLTMVQWRSLLDRYPRAVWVNSSIQLKRPVQPFPISPSIIVLTGTAERGFDRLLRGLDILIEGGNLPSTVFAQIGHSEYIPRNYAYVRFLPHSQLIDRIRASDVVITHDGAGSMREALGLGKRTIVVPRRSQAGELAYHSNLELATHLAARGWVEVVEDPLDIPKVLANRTIGYQSYEMEGGRDAKEVLSEFLDTVEQRVTGMGERPAEYNPPDGRNS